jgi:hypothetical protein
METKLIKSIFLVSTFIFMVIGSSGAYYTDSVAVTGNSFSTGTWIREVNLVINEVYYDTGSRTRDNGNGNGNGTEVEGKNEWIELYNPNSFAISLKDWSITDNHYTKSINANVSLPSHGFALLSHDSNTWEFWDVPNNENIVKINLSGSTDWLSNTGDRVVLKNPSGLVVDQMSYGTDTTIFNPSCIDIAEGHSLERGPLGFDTDINNNFVERENPTPGN